MIKPHPLECDRDGTHPTLQTLTKFNPDEILAGVPRYAGCTEGEWARNIPPANRYNTIYAGRNNHVAHLAVTNLNSKEIESNCEIIKDAKQNAALCVVLACALESMVKHVAANFKDTNSVWVQDANKALATYNELNGENSHG